MIELIGYIATAFVLISFCVKEMTLLRLINSGGSILWVWYGFMIDSKPIIFVNLAVLMIHSVWFIGNIKKKPKS